MQGAGSIQNVDYLTWVFGEIVEVAIFEIPFPNNTSSHPRDGIFQAKQSLHTSVIENPSLLECHHNALLTATDHYKYLLPLIISLIPRSMSFASTLLLGMKIFNK